MAERKLKIPSGMLALTSLLALTAFGCDQVSEMAKDVQSKVMEEETATVDATVEDESPAASVPEPAPAPQRPNPEELIADFEGLDPQQIGDAAMLQITSQPEAAAAIKTLEIKSPNFTAAGVNSLPLLRNLESLTLAALPLPADAFGKLSLVRSLKYLDISASGTDDSAIQSLTALPQLETLNVAGTRITPAIASSLGQMQALRDIDLTATQADDTVVAGLSALPIRRLQLSKTRITSAAMPTILAMKELEELDVSFTSVTGVSFKGISRSNVRILWVAETQFGIEGFMAIKGMKALEELNAYKAGLVEHKSNNVFRTMPKLRVLYAGMNGLTDAGMDVFFKGHRSLEELRLGNNSRITNNGLAALVGVKSLKHLDVTGTLVDSNGALALKQKLPDCQILTSSGRY